jgi:hypothetical protein
MDLVQENGATADGLLQALAVALRVLRQIAHMVTQVHTVPGSLRNASVPIRHQSLNMRWRRPVWLQPMGGESGHETWKIWVVTKMLKPCWQA